MLRILENFCRDKTFCFIQKFNNVWSGSGGGGAFLTLVEQSSDGCGVYFYVVLSFGWRWCSGDGEVLR